jgi:hypothetical protein
MPFVVEWWKEEPPLHRTTVGIKPALAISRLTRPCGAAGIAPGFRDLTIMSASECMAEGQTCEPGLIVPT